MSDRDNATRIQQQIQANREQGLDQASLSMAQEQAMRMAQEQDREGYWRVVTDADVGRDGEDELPEFIASETTGMLALGNITRPEYHGNQWRIENQFDTIQNEFLDADSPIDEIDAATMFGSARPKGTDEAYRRLRSAEMAAKQMHSLSINAQGLRSGTEIHTVAKSEKIADDEDGGMLSGVKRKLI